jgi:hypothetical protein
MALQFRLELLYFSLHGGELFSDRRRYFRIWRG